MLRLALITVSLLAGAAQAQDLDALKIDTRKNALPVLPKVVGMMQETVAAKADHDVVSECVHGGRQVEDVALGPAEVGLGDEVENL